MDNSLTHIDELKRLELRFLMADDQKISQVMEVIFLDILRKFFEQDVMESRSLEIGEKVKTLVNICNCIRDRIVTSNYKKSEGPPISPPIKQILEFMILEEFNSNISLNKIIQLYLQELIYDMLKNAILQKSSHKETWIGLLFQAWCLSNISKSFRNKLFFLFIHWVPRISKDFSTKLRQTGFPQILLEEDRMKTLKQCSAFVLDYYNFMVHKSELKSMVVSFKDEVLAKDSDPANLKFNVSKMTPNDTLKFLGLNLLEFLGTVFKMNEITQSQEMTSEDVEEEKIDTSPKKNEKLQEEDDKSYPPHSHEVIPILVLSTASPINEINEKAKEFLKGYEKHSDMDHSSVEAMEEAKSEHGQNASKKSTNAMGVWSKLLEFYLNISKAMVPNNLQTYDDPSKKTLLLFSRNLKRNILEYALKCEITAKMPQFMTALNDEGEIRFLGLLFVEHMIKHLNIVAKPEVTMRNAKAIYLLMSKLIDKPDFFSTKERSLAYCLLVEVIVKTPSLIEIDKKTSEMIMDQVFGEFIKYDTSGGHANEEIFTNWIRCVSTAKLLFKESAKKDIVISKINSHLDSAISGAKSKNVVFVCLDWIQFLCDPKELPVQVMYNLAVLCHHDDLRVRDKAGHIFEPLHKELLKWKTVVDKLKNKETESTLISECKESDDWKDPNRSSMFIKKVSDFMIYSMSDYKTAQELQEISLWMYILMAQNEDRKSIQKMLENTLINMLSSKLQKYSQDEIKTLQLLNEYISYTLTYFNLPLHNEPKEFIFLLQLFQTSKNVKELTLSFDILNTILKSPNSSDLYSKCIELLSSSQVSFECTSSLTFLCLSHCLTHGSPIDPIVVEKYNSISSIFNQLSTKTYKSLDQILVFSHWISRLAEDTNLQTMGEGTQEPFDLVVWKLIEVADDKQIKIEIRAECVQEFLSRIYQHTDIYKEHLAYLREQYAEYDIYEFHKAIGRSHARLLKADDVQEYFDGVFKVFEEEKSTLISKRATLVQMCEFFMRSKVVKEFQHVFQKIQRILFDFVFDKKPIIQEYSSIVMTKVYQLADKDTKEALVVDIFEALGGPKSTGKTADLKTASSDVAKMKSYKELWDIANEFGQRDIIYFLLSVFRQVSNFKEGGKDALSLRETVVADKETMDVLNKNIPKIMLLNYSPKEEIRVSMKEIMFLISPKDKRRDLVKDHWDNVINEMFEALEDKKDFNKRLMGCLALSEIISNEEWSKIKPIFEKVFNTAFALLSDTNDKVKEASMFLLEALKKTILKNGNIYTWTNMKELKEIYEVAMPLIISKGIHSSDRMLTAYFLLVIYEILKTTKEEGVADLLKVKNSREDKQLIYTYNSKGKMRDVLSPYLKEIIIANLESMTEFENNQWNSIESQLEEKKGKESNYDHYLNDKRIESSKNSEMYEMLAIWKNLLTEESLNETLPEIIKIIKKGVGISTRAGACNFLIETSLDRPDLFDLKLTKRVFKSWVDILSDAKSTKESLLKVVCRLGGSLFRIFSSSFKAVQDALSLINEKLCADVEKYSDLIEEGIDKYWISYLLIVREAIKNMKDIDLAQDRGALVEQIIPYLFWIKNNTLDNEQKREQLQKLGAKIFKEIFEDRISIPVEVYEDVILKHIKALLDSSNFRVRSNGMAALADLWEHVDEVGLLGRLKDKGVLDLAVNKSMNNSYFGGYIKDLNRLIDFWVGGRAGLYVRSNAILLENLTLKLTKKLSNQFQSSEKDIFYRKQVISLLTTVAWIVHHLSKLEYDSPKDFESVKECQSLLFPSLTTYLSSIYPTSTPISSAEISLHQSILPCLAYSPWPPCELITHVFPCVSWELRLGVATYMEVLLHEVCKNKKEVRELVDGNEDVQKLVAYLVGFVRENGEKYDQVLKGLSRVWNTVVQSTEGALRDDILEAIDEIFEDRVIRNEKIKKVTREQAFKEEEDGQITVETKHQLLKQENEDLIEIMQNYYLMKNSR